MKKICVLLLLLCLCFAVACAESEQSVSEEVFDAGNVQALVPKGWKAFPYADYFSEDPNATDPDIIRVCKGGKTEADLFSNPYLQINYYGPDIEMGSVELFYDNIVALAPQQIGNYTWNGFTTNDYGGTNAILYTTDGEHQFQVSVWMGDNEIHLEDADVQAIIASITLSADAS